MKKTILIALVLTIVSATGAARADFVFGTPTNLGSTVNSPFWEGCVNISADGLELYFDSPRPGGDGDFDLYDIYVTKRSSIDSNWSEPENLGPPVNSADNDSGPSISSDGLKLYFSSTRPGGYGEDDLWVATRPTTADQWGEPVNLGPTVNGPNWDYFPSISADGLELYFTSNRPGNHGFVDIWVSTRLTTEDDWKEPVNLGPPVNDTTWAESPSISTDGLALFFESDRTGGVGHNDIWMTRRVTRDHSWGEPVCLAAPANSPGYEKQPDISADGQTLYFGHFDDVDGPWDLWQVSIEPVVDLNGDGIIDADDMCIVVNNWGTDNQLCDVGPMPWGDGIVDVQDLIAVAEHLFEVYPSADTVDVDEADNGGQIELELGQILVVTLESNPSTGYQWEILENDESVLKQFGQAEFKPSDTSEQPMVGAGGWEIFRFKAVSAGQATLELVYHRTWEDAEPLKTFSIQVTVN